MIVTEINRQKNHLCEITLNTGRKFMLDSEYCRENSISVGDGISEEEINRHIAESDYKRALSRSVWYIERGDMSEKKLRQNLKAAGFGEIPANRAVLRMKEIGLINDETYAERMAESLLAQCVSRREAFYKMVNKGIPAQTAKQALDMFECDALAQIRHIVKKKYIAKMSSEESSKKVFAALMRKGFNYSDIKSVLKEFSNTEYGEE